MSTPEPSDSESYGDYSVDDEDQLQPGDSLGDSDLTDVLDRGYSAPEHWSVAQGSATPTGRRPRARLSRSGCARRTRRPDPYAEADAEPDEADPDPEIGDRRAGRLVESEQGEGGIHQDLFGDDVGIDGAGASAEEAAMHVIPDDGDARHRGLTGRRLTWRRLSARRPRPAGGRTSGTDRRR